MPKSSRQLQLEIDLALRNKPRTRNKARLEIAYPAELEQAGKHFHSGINAPGEVRGLAMSARNIGVTAGNVSDALLESLELHSFNGGPLLFVDSGAFSEVEFHKDGPPTVVQPMSDDTWRKRLKLYEILAAMYRIRCYLVAPDRVGDQQVTLARLSKYALQIAACAAHRANIIVPVQKGAIPMAEFYRMECLVLGLRTPPIAGIPMEKDATTLRELAEFAKSLPVFGARIHLLGIGPRAKGGRYAKAIAAIKGANFNCTITSDSALVPGLVGRTNGPGRGPRVLTRLQDEARASSWRDPHSTSKRRGDDTKAYALSKQGADEQRRVDAAAVAAGWRDTELDDD